MDTNTKKKNGIGYYSVRIQVWLDCMEGYDRDLILSRSVEFYGFARNTAANEYRLFQIFKAIEDGTYAGKDKKARELQSGLEKDSLHGVDGNFVSWYGSFLEMTHGVDSEPYKRLASLRGQWIAPSPEKKRMAELTAEVSSKDEEIERLKAELAAAKAAKATAPKAAPAKKAPILIKKTGRK